MARYIKKNGLLKPVSGAQFADTPIGTVIASFLAVAPSGYIKCDGTVYTKADYPELYERIPDVFKDTTNETFTIDLREVALKGIGLSSLTTEHYSSTGLTLGQFIDDRLQNHAHDIKVNDLYINYRYMTVNTGSEGIGTLVSRASATRNLGAVDIYSGRHGATTEVKAVGVNYFIKAKQIGVPADIMAGIEENFATKEYVDTVRTIDLSNYLTSSVTSTSKATAFINNKVVQITFHGHTTSATPAPGVIGLLNNIPAGLLPAIKDEDAYVVGSMYVRDTSSSSAYRPGFSAYNGGSNNINAYLTGFGSTYTLAANSTIEISITYISE